jgi:hypothetical protein
METNLLKRIQLAAPKLHARLFRNNVAQAWVGNAKRVSPTSVLIVDARPLHAGLCVGSSDLIGWTEVKVTPEMVGRKIAVFTAIEGKTGRVRVTPEQANFIQQVQAAGGFAGVAREPQDITSIITI